MSASPSRGRPPLQNKDRAFTLVIVLIILALLAVIAVGFLSSMTAERTAAVAYAAKAKAEQVTQAGVDSAMATLVESIRAFPDSCTVWDTKQGAKDSANVDGVNTEGTSLYFRARSPNPADAVENRPPMITPDPTPDQRQIYVLPLTSGVIGAVARLETEKDKALPILNTSEPLVAKQNFVDLNAPRFKNDTEGWIGTPPDHKDKAGARTIKPVLVPWVETKDARGAVDGRYAYWIEDESFKANINFADLGDPKNEHVRRDNLGNPPATDKLGYIGPRDVDLLGPLGSADDPTTALAAAVRDARLKYPTSLFPEARGYAHAIGMATSTADRLRFLTTTTSGGLNLSRHGSQRVNLNAAIPSKTDPTDTAEIKKQIDKVVRTIQFHAPNFGQRFFRNSATPTAANLNAFTVGAIPDPAVGDYSLIYLTKVAANIRDYIDEDFLPTIVLNGGQIAASKPNVSLEPAPWAQGKDSAPFIQEAAVRFTGDVTAGKYTLNADYYIEVWNMGTKDVVASRDLGTRPFIGIAGPAPWFGTDSTGNDASFTTNPRLIPDDGGPSPSDSRPITGTPPLPRDYQIDISGLVFPAGMATVITTDSVGNHANAPGAYRSQNWKTVITNLEATKHVVEAAWFPPGKSTYHGSMPTITKGSATVVTDAIRLKFGEVSSDYETDVFFGNANGYIDSTVTLPMSYSGGSTGFRLNDPKGGTNGQKYAPLGGYLRGNWTGTGLTDGLGPSALGDPRTNNEQLAFYKTEGTPSEATRFKNYLQQAALSAPPSHPGTANGVYPTLGLPNYMSCRPTRAENPWADFPPYYADPLNVPKREEIELNKDKAAAVVADAPLGSIGQLGDVFDPARILNNANAIQSSRGGGRTFKIGQHDDRWDGDETSASRAWTSWRLLDFFSIADHVDLSSTQPGQPRLVDYYGIEQPGVININGAARDNGAALKAAVKGFEFQHSPSADLVLGDTVLGGARDGSTKPEYMNMESVVTQVVNRLTTPITKLTPENTTKNVQTGSGPFWERGELSELPLFGRSPSTGPNLTYATTDLTKSPSPANPNYAPSTDVSSAVYDRGREELFRRLAELITTRGNTFTVYAVGQSVLQPPPTTGNPNPAKTYSALHRQRVTFKLIPKAKDPITNVVKDFHPGTDEDGKTIDFKYTNDAQLNTRFQKPDHYEIQVIASNAGY